MLSLTRCPLIKEQDAAVGVSRAVEAAHPEMFESPLVGEIKSPKTAQKIGQGSVAVFLDFVSCDDGYRRRGFGDFLLIFGCGEYRGNILEKDQFASLLPRLPEVEDQRCQNERKDSECCETDSVKVTSAFLRDGWMINH